MQLLFIGLHPDLKVFLGRGRHLNSVNFLFLIAQIAHGNFAGLARQSVKGKMAVGVGHRPVVRSCHFHHGSNQSLTGSGVLDNAGHTLCAYSERYQKKQ